MPSLQDAIATARSRKKLPFFTPGSVHSLGQQLGLSAPISVQDIFGALDGLPPASLSFSSGPMTTGYVHGSVTLFVQSDGSTAYSGQVQEAGISGDDFLFITALLDVQDSSGKTAVFVHTDNVAGQLDIGFSEKNWNDIGSTPAISLNWDSVVSTRVQHTLHISSNPWQVTETVLLGALVAAGIVLAGVFVAGQSKQCQDNGMLNCGWVPIGSPMNGPMTPGDPNNPPPGGAGMEYRCRCEFN